MQTKMKQLLRSTILDIIEITTGVRREVLEVLPEIQDFLLQAENKKETETPILRMGIIIFSLVGDTLTFSTNTTCLDKLEKVFFDGCTHSAFADAHFRLSPELLKIYARSRPPL